MTQLAVANEILRQPGGGRFRMMTGAKDFLATENGLRFRVPRATIVQIDLTPADLYDVKFIKVHGGKTKVVAEHKGIYNDMLVPIFEKQTGLYTTL